MNICPVKIATFIPQEVVKVKNFDLVKKIEVIDTKTLDRYKKQSMIEIVRKTIFIFLFNPVILVLKISFNLLQIGFDFSSYFLRFFDMAKELANINIFKVFEISITSRVDIVKNIVQDVVYIIRAPFYALALQFASVFSIVAPNHTRTLIAKIELSWNYNMDVSYDYRRNSEFKNKSLFRALFHILWHRKQDVVFYLAPCFQPLGSLKDKHIIHPETI